MQLHRLVGALAATAIAGLAVVTGASPASAHTTDISGVATCIPASGTYSIAWSGATHNVPAGAVGTVTVIEHDPAKSTVPTTVATDIAPDAPYSFTQEGIPNDATQASVKVRVDWTGTDTWTAEATGTVTLPGGCSAPVVPVVPAEPTQSTPNCAQPDIAVTLPTTSGITYQASGSLTLSPGQSTTITPVANEGVALSPDAHPWTITNDFRGTSCSVPVLTPATPTKSKVDCANPVMKVSLPKTKHITYKTSRSLVLKPGQSVTITPAADAGFTLARGTKPITIKNTFDPSAKCSVATPTTPLAYTGASVGPLAIGGLVSGLGGLFLYAARRARRV